MADDIRAAGWSVAVHNDYRLNGVPHTFWLFTKDGRAVKGEGRSDAEALNEVRFQIGLSLPTRSPAATTPESVAARRKRVIAAIGDIPVSGGGMIACYQEVLRQRLGAQLIEAIADTALTAAGQAAPAAPEVREDRPWFTIDTMPRDGTVVETNAGDTWFDTERGFFTDGNPDGQRRTIYRWRHKASSPGPNGGVGDVAKGAPGDAE